MNHEVDSAPALAHLLERLIKRIHAADVAVDQHVGSELRRERTNPFLERFALIGEGEFGAMIAQGTSNSPCE